LLPTSDFRNWAQVWLRYRCIGDVLFDGDGMERTRAGAGAAQKRREKHMRGAVCQGEAAPLDQARSDLKLAIDGGKVQ
jgi:hypothetical protein